MIGSALVALLLAQSQIPQQSDPPYTSTSPTRLGDNMPRPQERSPTDPASVVQMQEFGRCVARHLPTRAAAVLRMDFTAAPFGEALRKLAHADLGCMPRGKQARFAPVLFAGALAEELLSRNGDLTVALTYDPAKAPVKAISESDMVASCVARTSPGEVAGLFATRAASDAESVAIRALVPAVQQCVSTGQQARFNRPGLRAILATASYRIVQSGNAPAQPS